MRKTRFEEVSPVERAVVAITLVKDRAVGVIDAVRSLIFDGLFWRISALLSDIEAAVEKRLPVT